MLILPVGSGKMPGPKEVSDSLLLLKLGGLSIL